MRWGVLASAAVVLFMAAPAFAARTFDTGAGALDTTFNGTGKVAITTGWDAGLLAPAPNDGLYVTMQANQYSGNYPARILRLKSNGTPDPTFGTSGHADVDLGNGGLYRIDALVPDGSGVLVLLFDNSNFSFGVVRLTATGHFDSTFGSGGRLVFTKPAGNDVESFAAAHVLPDGRIELVIDKDQLFLPHAGGFVLMRLRPNGSPDPTLGPYGVKTLVTWSSTPDGPTGAHEAAFTGNGKVYLTIPYGQGARTTLERRATTGAADPTFNGNGSRSYACPDWQATVDGPHLLVDSTGRPLLFCTSQTYDVDVARFTTAGTGDSTFGTGGHLHASTGASAVAYGVDGSNRVVVEYMTDTGDAPTVVHLRRYTSAGLDASFATSGTATLTFPSYYELSGAPTFGTSRIYFSLWPPEAPPQVIFAVTA